MAKKPKLDLSKEGLKKLAIEHCEKLVFGICALLLLLLAYWGYSKPVFDDSQNNPNSLISKAQQSRTRINATTWANPNNEELSFAKYRIADEEVANKVEKLNAIKLDPSKFPTFAPGEISLSIKPKRINPEVLAATDVNAKFAYQLIALNPGVGGSDQISRALFAPKPKKVKKRRRPKKDKKKNDMRSGQSGMQDGAPKQDEGSPGSGGSGGVPSSGGGMSSGGGSSKSEDLMPDGPVHEPPAEMLEALEGVPLDGMIPSESAGGKTNYPSVMWRQVVCVTAIVPFKKQVEAYEKALKGTRRYDPETDIPKYIGLVISRRINGGEWKDVTDEIKAFSKKAETVTFPRLVVGDEYDPFLNAKVPALLMKDFDQFVLHPKSNIRDFLELEEKETASDDTSDKSSSSFEDLDDSEPKEDGDVEEEFFSDILTSENAAENKQVRFFDLLANSAIKPGDKLEYRVNVILSNPNLPLAFVTGTETSSGPMNSGRMGSGRGGMSSRGGSAEDRSGDLMMGGGANPPGGGGGASPPGMSGGGGSTPSSGGMMGGGRSGSRGRSGPAISTSAELTLEMLGNPNITDSDLDGTIRPEILKFKDMDPPELTDKGLEKKYGLVSPDSSVSNAVQFVVPSEEFVGGGAAPLTVRRADNVEFYDAEPKGEVVFMKHDKSLHLPVPGKATVSAGTPVVFETMARVFNPLDWSIRWIGPPGVDKDGEPDPKTRGDYRFRSKAIVLDVQQSKTLDNITDLKQEFLTPAEVLVFDGGNGFTLRNELDDVMAFRHATFADDAAEEEEEELGGFGDKSGGGGAGGTGDLPSFGDN